MVNLSVRHGKMRAQSITLRYGVEVHLSAFLGAKRKYSLFSLLKQNLQLQAEQAGQAVGETTCKKSVGINVLRFTHCR